MSAKPVPPIDPLAAPYWEGTAKGELRVQHCGACDARFLYAHALCPKCWTPDPAWDRVKGHGRIVAATIVHQAPYAAFAGDVPYAVLIVRLEEGPTLMANFVGDDPTAATIGRAVEVVFEQRGGVALPQFRLATPE